MHLSGSCPCGETSSNGVLCDELKFREPSVVLALIHRLSIPISDQSIALKSPVLETPGTSSLAGTEFI